MGNSNAKGKIDKSANKITHPKLQRVNTPKWIKTVENSDKNKHLYQDSMMKLTREINKIVANIFGIEFANNDIMDVIYSFTFNIYSNHDKVEISMTDSYVKDKILNVFDKFGRILQGIDFNPIHETITNILTQKIKKIDRNRGRDIRFNRIMYSQFNNHIWIIYDDYYDDTPPYSIFYTYLICDVDKIGDVTFKKPLIKLSNECTKQLPKWIDHYCSSNGDLFLCGDDMTYYINSFVIEYDDKNGCDNNVVVESSIFEWSEYKIDNVGATWLVIHNGQDLNKFFDDEFSEKLQMDRYYLCMFYQTPCLRIYVFDLIQSKLIIKYIDETIIVSNIIDDDKQINNEKRMKLYKFNCDCSQIIVCCYDFTNPQQMYSPYNLYAYHINLFQNKTQNNHDIDNIKKGVNNFQLIQDDIYGEGGFVVDYILDSINMDKYYIWFRINGRGIGYNITKYLELDRNNLSVLTSKSGQYENPVDKKLVINLK